MRELSKTAPDARSAAAFWRDDEQTACAAGRKREARVCESASKKADNTQAESAKRGFAGRGNSRKLETGRPAVGGTLIHVIGACPVIKTAEAGDRRME